MKRAAFIASLALAATSVAAGSASAATAHLPTPRQTGSLNGAHHHVARSFFINHPKLRGLGAPKLGSKPSKAGQHGASSARGVMHTDYSGTAMTFAGWQATSTAGYYWAMFYEYNDGAYDWEADMYSWNGSTLHYQGYYYLYIGSMPYIGWNGPFS
jgi:hypothetical protein